ncbi:uncharacterized protein A1O5_06714 [Cladophialophora psammophila CBS 110553]|uniref:Uncharacterized protein n=1 Tax=Cladophialophora psammophila CBS 110553 TaxID=1182543 RepID=W9WRS9_9EURO|nr:uncharacterized protein A1O5_06714 [Cladophialophora psammophila CBS 110553]EXJ70643.1 hypothetical protein A1O5_06714 [Cladophialophora psammophila CBS 110553]
MDRRPLTLVEKIIAANAIDIESLDDVRPGNVVVLRVSWVLSSEASWVGINKTYSQLGRPQVHRRDRIWLAQDHTVDPRVNSRPEVKRTIDLAEAAAKEIGIVDYYGPNYTIMHTEFCRERAQPGQVIVGSDSHTCSAGSLEALAIGLGAADVTIPMITGETWLNIPPVLGIKFINQPPFGIGGKDIILYVLGRLKRNTVAAGRAVEFMGPGLKYLSADARFAISNMVTEFGGIAGVFVPDSIISAYLSRRKDTRHQDCALYFQPDPGAQYAEVFEIDLTSVGSLVALYPSSDNIVPVGEVLGKELDGCFIGACTTAEEDLILAALVLRQGFKAGLEPNGKGKRKVTPGSIPILNRLRDLGLLLWFQRAGFEIGAPGCSYCVGVAADVAGEGEVWLSSQNRNFPYRMGPGSYANLASAATVAASSFSMKVTDPSSLLNGINRHEFDKIRQLWVDELLPVRYSEPVLKTGMISSSSQEDLRPTKTQTETNIRIIPEGQQVIKGKCILFGDNVDTDAVSQSHSRTTTQPYEILVRDRGLNIVVAGNAFGCGSSREEAPRALKGSGVKAVIAKSFAFIYSRNHQTWRCWGL